AVLLRYTQEGRVDARVVDQRFEADVRAVRKRRDAALEVQHLGDRHGDDLPPERGEVCAQLRDAVVIGAQGAADVHGATDLEDVSPVEGSGRGDLEMGDAGGFERLAGRVDLPTPGVRAGASDHGAITEHDHRILDEHAV